MCVCVCVCVLSPTKSAGETKTTSTQKLQECTALNSLAGNRQTLTGNQAESSQKRVVKVLGKNGRKSSSQTAEAAGESKYNFLGKKNH